MKYSLSQATLTNASGKDRFSWIDNNFEGQDVGAAYKALLAENDKLKYKDHAMFLLRLIQQIPNYIPKDLLIEGDIDGSKLISFSDVVTLDSGIEDIRAHIELLLRCLANADDAEFRVNSHRVVIFDVCSKLPPPFVPHNGDPNYVSFQLSPEISVKLPSDGSQPTIAGAINLSGARCPDTNLISEWYMRIFGVIPIQGMDPIGNYYVYSVSDGNGDGVFFKPIFNFGTWGINGYSEADEKERCRRRALFIDNFKKIASSAVGRVLLYRILIEIIRTKDGAGLQTTTFDHLNPNNLALRNSNRSITLVWFKEFKHSNGLIFFSECTFPQAAIGMPDSTGKTVEIIKQQNSKPLDIALFHEMLHWFHSLIDYNRATDERNQSKQFKLSDRDIGKYYWGDLLQGNPDDISSQISRSEIPWYNGHVCDFEEMRTILGFPEGLPGYLNGDDLSENLYRTEQGFPLRFGYSGFCFFEDKKVIDKVVGCATLTEKYSEAVRPIMCSVEGCGRPIRCERGAEGQENLKGLGSMQLGKNYMGKEWIYDTADAKWKEK
jgi:hypothetical protein